MRKVKENFKPIQTVSNQILNHVQTVSNSKNQEGISKDDLWAKLIRSETEKQELASNLSQLKANLKLLPAGGDPAKFQTALFKIAELKTCTKPQFLRGSKVNKLWKEVERLLKITEN